MIIRVLNQLLLKADEQGCQLQRIRLQNLNLAPVVGQNKQLVTISPVSHRLYFLDDSAGRDFPDLRVPEVEDLLRVIDKDLVTTV